MSICAIIPARLHSTRLPKKALIRIQEKSLLHHVYDNVKKSKRIDDVFIACDHISIKEEAERFSAKVIMTSEECESGTDRILEAIQNEELNYDLLVNVQGDEPLIQAELIDQAIQSLEENPDSVVSTLASRKLSDEDYHDANRVKVILNKNSEAIYFSRSPIPYNRESTEKPKESYLHIGLYVYRMSFLKKFKQLEKSVLESYEKLEQLRILENNYRISVSLTDFKPIGVDVESDIEKVSKRLETSIL